MEIDIKLLDKCSELTEYEKDLVRRIDVDHESQSSVANNYTKKPSTICTQHKKALAKFTKWVDEREKREKVPSEEDFDRKVFRMFRRGILPDKVIEKLGNVDRVLSLWEKYQKLKENDYYQAQSKIAQCGYETNGDSDYPLCEQLDNLIAEKDMLIAEDDKVRVVLEKQGVTAGRSFGGYGSISDGVQKLADKLFQTQSVLVSVSGQKENLSRRLEETENRLSHTEVTLDDTQRKVTKLQPLEKYEHISEEERKSLELAVSATRKLIEDLKHNVDELQTQKTRLESDIDWLKELKTNVERDIQDAVLVFMENLQLPDVLKLYNAAVKSKLRKAILAQ